ncbi:general transcription factor IIIA, b isoform X2 [Paramormyrops kingsleyae]|uniref:general transcription factor IIIA, b isoform X2 n=1 Tax=Paramormyrops kingsleyae TaxID=1676925 RepID=UPI000CD64884|nr:transcription factor IIIA-like isoform X2 [Paramormyrops kingsleyae]
MVGNMEVSAACFGQRSFVLPFSVLAMGEKIQEPGKTYICSFPDCGASYNKSWKLEAHLCKHTGMKPFVCETDGCDKSFCTRNHLSRHMLSHSGERPFRCSVEGCPKAFTTNSNMRKHVSRRHQSMEKPYVCGYDGCGQAFKKNMQLKSHEYTHTNLPPFQCNFEGCGRRFTVPSRLRRHEKVHAGYPCTEDGCDFQGKTWSEYQKHRKEKHQAQYQCPSCSKVFKDSWVLRQHQHVHQKVREVFHCPREGCERTYTTMFNLQSHILSFHEEVRPFACTYPGCTKTFVMKQSLMRHGVVHDPEKKKLQKPRPRRSLASRLSGYRPKQGSQSESSKLAMLLKDTSLDKADKPSSTLPE